MFGGALPRLGGIFADRARKERGCGSEKSEVRNARRSGELGT